MKTLIVESEDYSLKALALYKKLGQVYFCTSVEALKKQGPKFLADILVVRLKYAIDRFWIDKMPNLKIIATPTTGLNHIDIGYSKSKGIEIISLRGHTGFLRNITSTAELAFGLMISLVRNINPAFENIKKESQWDRMSFRGYQLSGKILGIIGYGRLGKIMARYGKALGMKIVAYDPYVKPARGVDFVSLEKLLKISDVVSLHALLTEKNHSFLKLKHFRLMKPTAYFINTARAELIEKQALYKALSQKMIAGSAIDVMDNELSDGAHLKQDFLWKYAKAHDNLIITPHIGGATFEAMHITEDFIAKEVEKFVKSGKLR